MYVRMYVCAVASGDRLSGAADARLLRRQRASGGVPERGWGDASAAGHECGRHPGHSGELRHVCMYVCIV